MDSNKVDNVLVKWLWRSIKYRLVYIKECKTPYQALLEINDIFSTAIIYVLIAL